MARVIKFCTLQAYQTGTVYSDIFEVTDIARLDAELRIMSITGTAGTGITGSIETTSDPCFDSSAWQTVTGSPTASLVGTVAGTQTGVFTGLGRFVRAKLIVAGTSGMATACLTAVGREP